MINQNGITFKSVESVNVFIEGKQCGVIKQDNGGYRYYPRGSKIGGDWKYTIAEIKSTLF